MTTLVDLTAEQLVHHVAHLATRFRAPGAAPDGVAPEDLVLAARRLDALCDDPTGRRWLAPRDIWLQRDYGSSPVDPASATGRMDTVRNEVGGRSGFFAATAGQIRRVFAAGRTSAADWLACHCLATLPRELPADDETSVVLYATGKSQVASLLSTAGRGESTVADVEKLVSRVVRQHKYPWEC